MDIILIVNALTTKFLFVMGLRMNEYILYTERRVPLHPCKIYDCKTILLFIPFFLSIFNIISSNVYNYKQNLRISQRTAQSFIIPFQRYSQHAYLQKTQLQSNRASEVNET